MPCREVLLAFPRCPNLLLLGAFLKLKLDFIKSKFSFKKDSGKRQLEQRKKAKSPAGRKPKIPKEEKQKFRKKEGAFPSGRTSKTKQDKT